MNNEIILTEDERKLIEERRNANLPGAHLQNSKICVSFEDLKDEVKERYIQESIERMEKCRQDLITYPRPPKIIPESKPKHLRSVLSYVEAKIIHNEGYITWMMGMSPLTTSNIHGYDLYEYYVCLRN